MKIEWNQTENIISVGEAKFTSFTNFNNALGFAHHIFAENKIELVELTAHKVAVRDKTPRMLKGDWGIADDPTYKYLYTYQQRYKAIGDKLGCSLAVFYKNFQKLQRKAFIVPVYPIYKNLSEYQPWKLRKGNSWNTKLLDDIYKKRDKLQPVMDDGLKHLLPLVCTLNRTPQELRKIFKKDWKVLANNSLYKNKKLMKTVVHNLFDMDHKDVVKTQETIDRYKTNISLNLPTSLIQYLYLGYSHKALKWAENFLKGTWSKEKIITDSLRMFQDMERMAEELSVKTDSKWTPRRVKEEHDRMSKEITARKYSKDVFDSVKDIPCKALKAGEYVATLLDSAFLIADEGNSMGHCVAGYADQVRQGDYLVYSVTKDGERSSTIGINKRQTSFDVIGSHPETRTYWYLQQQYGRYNAHVKDEEERKLAAALVGLLNKQSLTEV